MNASEIEMIQQMAENSAMERCRFEDYFREEILPALEDCYWSDIKIESARKSAWKAWQFGTLPWKEDHSAN
jgi:hypothetical protein